MEREQINIIREVEMCKDIIWYLRGQVDLSNGENLYGYPFSKEYIQALESIISYVSRTLDNNEIISDYNSCSKD